MWYLNSHVTCDMYNLIPWGFSHVRIKIKNTVKFFLLYYFLHRRCFRLLFSFYNIHLLSQIFFWNHRKPRDLKLNSRFLFFFSCDLMSFIIGFHTKQQYLQICEIQTLTIIIVCKCWNRHYFLLTMSSSSIHREYDDCNKLGFSYLWFHDRNKLIVLFFFLAWKHF